MTLTRFQKIALAIAGFTATLIGAFITFAPQAFYHGYGIEIASDPNMLSELRAPGAGLFALGMLMLSGLTRASMLPIALAAGLTVYLGFPAGRIVSLIVDGVPSASVIGALGIEVVIAALLIAAFGLRPSRITPDPVARSLG